jgi:hypothetical protein
MAAYLWTVVGLSYQIRFRHPVKTSGDASEKEAKYNRSDILLGL